MDEITVEEVGMPAIGEEDIISELREIKDLQIQSLQNAVEFGKISLVFIGLLLAILLGSQFIKVGFKNG